MELQAVEAQVVTSEIIIIASIFVVASLFLFTILELRTVKVKCELLERELETQYKRGFENGYDAAHSEHYSTISEIDKAEI